MYNFSNYKREETNDFGWKKDWHSGYKMARLWNNHGSEGNYTPTRPLQFAQIVGNQPGINRLDLLRLAKCINTKQTISFLKELKRTGERMWRGQHSSVFAVLSKNQIIEYDRKTNGYYPGPNWSILITQAAKELKQRKA
jgi:hypothetical protein